MGGFTATVRDAAKREFLVCEIAARWATLDCSSRAESHDDGQFRTAGTERVWAMNVRRGASQVQAIE
jgi:hypothetical protein